MKVSRILASTAATIALVGSFGLANAQTSSQQTEQQRMQGQATTPNQVTPSNQNLQNQRGDSTGTMNRDSTYNSTTGVSNDRSTTGATSRDAGEMRNERIARVDRN